MQAYEGTSSRSTGNTIKTHSLEYIEEDEYVEVTPTQLRLRKITLKEADRRRDSRKAGS